MKGQFVFLGTGGSMGVPMIGCKCPVCTSSSPKDKRWRTSGLLTIDGKNILIDCGPDFREQALKNEIDSLDGVIITHAHNDHIAGIDELRAYLLSRNTPMPCLMSSKTSDDLHLRFDYIFLPKDHKERLIPKISPVIFPGSEGKIDFLGLEIRYFTYLQAGMAVIGLRIGNFAYLTDIKDYTDSIFPFLEGVETLVVSALRYAPSHLHFCVEEAVQFSKKTSAKETWLTHISHELSHDGINASLPPTIRPAYDGLKIDILG